MVRIDSCEGKCFGNFDGAINLLTTQYAARAIPESACAVLSAIVYNAEGTDDPDSPVKGWVRVLERNAALQVILTSLPRAHVAREPRTRMLPHGFELLWCTL